MGTTPGWKFYERHLNYFYTKDVDGLVENDYNEDAALMTHDFNAKGREALRKVFHNYIETLGDIKLKSTDKFAETEDTIFLEATLETSKLGERKVYDAFVLKNGKISYHFTGVR